MERKALIEIYKKIIELTETSELKGKNMLYTSANGYMYSLINAQNQLGFRLSKEDQKLFDEKYGAAIFKSHGSKMKDYVLIPEKLWKILKFWLLG